MRSLFALAVAILSGCGGDCISPTGCDKYTGSTNGGGTTAVVVPDSWVSSVPVGTVVIRAEGTASTVDVSYIGGGASGNVNSAPLPWQRTFAAEEGRFISISAQNTSATGTVRVLIATGGKLLNEASTNAPQGYTSVNAQCC